MDKSNWLTDDQIDFASEFFKYKYPNTKIYLVFDFQVDLTHHNVKYDFNRNENLIMTISVNRNHWITLTNIDCENNKQTTQNKIFIYDSLNNFNYIDSLREFLQKMFPNGEKSIKIQIVKMKYIQQGWNDCGLFSLAYQYALCERLEPSSLRFDQSNMRLKYNNYLESLDGLEFDINIVDHRKRETEEIEIQLEYVSFKN